MAGTSIGGQSSPPTDAETVTAAARAWAADVARGGRRAAAAVDTAAVALSVRGTLRLLARELEEGRPTCAASAGKTKGPRRGPKRTVSPASTVPRVEPTACRSIVCRAIG